MKFSLYSKKNVLDEMQEQTHVAKLGSVASGLMWGGLLAAMVIQLLTGNAEKAIGEWVVFMAGCVYTCCRVRPEWPVGPPSFFQYGSQCGLFSAGGRGGYGAVGAWPMAIGWALRLLVFRQVCSALHCSNSVHIW